MEDDMTKNHASIAAAALALALAWGAPLPAAPPAAPGTISIEATGADAELRASVPAFVNAMDEALTAKGFTILQEPGHAAYVAELSLSRAEVGTGTAKVPVSGSVITPGDSSSRVGAGITVPLPTGKSRLVPLQRTRLELRIRKRGEESTMWQGAAITVRGAGTKKGQDEAVASDLTQAILRAYPAEPEDVIGVP
jgi:hypothetical protein